MPSFFITRTLRPLFSSSPLSLSLSHSLSLNSSFFRPSVRLSLSYTNIPTLRLSLSFYLSPAQNAHPGAHFSSINFLVQFIFIMIRTSRRTLLSYPPPPPVDPILPLSTTAPPIAYDGVYFLDPSFTIPENERFSAHMSFVPLFFFFWFSSIENCLLGPSKTINPAGDRGTHAGVAENVMGNLIIRKTRRVT